MSEEVEITEGTPDILEIDTEDVPELLMVPEGKYNVTIMALDWKVSSNENDYLNVRMEVDDQPLANDVYHILMHPEGAKTPKIAVRSRAAFRDFKECFGIPQGTSLSTPEDLSEILGSTGSVETRMDKDQEGKDVHKIRLFRPAR